MAKKVYIGENDLMKIKSSMAGNNVSHRTFVSEDKPPYEEDEFEIGAEGGNNDFFHINESRLTHIDLSEVGLVEYEWYFDEEEYEEWLQDLELVDSDEVRNQYYTEEVTYGVEYFDNETFHHMESDQNLLYDELVDLFGEKMAQQMLQNCIQNGGGKFETYELYEDNAYDLTNPNELNDIAMKLFKHGEYYKNCRGFILSNGVVVYTPSEHNEICMIPGVNSKFDFIEMGNIRLLPNSIDMGSEPTSEQEEVLRQVIASYSDDELYLDIFDKGEEIGAKYISPDWRYVIGEINRYYSDGIRPQGSNGLYENKNIVNENTFEKWFGNSILKDENGQPIKMYHGTNTVFNEFSKEHIGKTGSYEGYGFNFTPYESRARSYSSENVIEAYLRVENPLSTKENKISLGKLMKIIAEIDKGKSFTNTIVAAYEPAGYKENWDERYYRRALPVAAKTIYQYNRENGYGDAGIYAEICLNGNADVIKTIDVFEKLGYDSAIFYDNSDRLNTVVVFEANQIKRTTNKTFSNDSNVMDENMETEVEASEVKLDSFKKNDTLAPKIWNHFELNPRVRLKLLDIADDFWDFANVTWVKRKGIHLTGSICNYNWSKYSDIDLHIVVDFSDIDERTDFVQEYFDGKKNEWNNEHSKLKIYGYPVELYVEDINAETASNGLYDLEANKWIKKPSVDNIKQIGLDKYEIKNKSAKLMTSIDDLYDAFNDTDDDAELREIGNKAHKLLNKIKRMRKFGLQRGGESDVFNIIYKVLRRAGYMDTIWKLSSELYDKINSIGLDESIMKEDIDLFSLAKKYFGTTYDFRECGFILPDGSMLDLSGRHQGGKEEDVAGRRRIEHRSVEYIGDDDTIVSLSMFINAGAIRCDIRSGIINLIKKPTLEQVSMLSRFILRCKGNIVLEIGDTDNSIDYVEYNGVNYKRVINDIFNFFDNGIKPSSLMESIKKMITLNEEVVADGNAEHNPFKAKWKHERDMLKNYLVNYGEIMTSKENGKEYKVLYDSFISGRLGTNFCICIQWNSMTMEPGNVIYVRAFDKFTRRRFKAQYDTRGYDNIAGTGDDIV